MLVVIILSLKYGNWFHLRMLGCCENKPYKTTSSTCRLECKCCVEPHFTTIYTIGSHAKHIDTHKHTPMELCVLCIFGLSNWGELLGYWKQSNYGGGNIISCNQATRASYWTFLKTFLSLNYNLILQYKLEIGLMHFHFRIFTLVT